MLINKDKFKTTAIIVAGGTGSRMKYKIPKQFIIFNKKPILIHKLSVFGFCNFIQDIILVCLKDYIYYC